MVAIIGGKGIGLERSSAWVLGSQGQLGEAPLGRGEDNVYVNAATGNLVITRRDEFLIGRGPDVSIDRTYNSQTVAGLTDGDNNDQWRMGVYRKVTGLSGSYGGAGSSVKRIDWDGSDTLYTWSSADAAYVATDGSGAYDKLTRASGVWTWTDGDTQIVESYDDNNGGRITARTDTDGNGLTYTYNGAGLITRVTNSNGAYADEYTELVYGGTGGTQLLKLETHAGGTLTRVFYTYDAYNRLSQVKVNLDPTDNSDAIGANYVYTYTYTNTTDKRIASIGQSDGSLINITYVQVGSVYKVSTLTQTVAWGGTRQTSFSYQTGATVVTDNVGQQTRLIYDANQNLTRIVHPSDSMGESRVLRFDYNWNGDVTSATLGPSHVITYTYDSRGNRLMEQDSAGDSVIRTYGSKNQVLTERSYDIGYMTTGDYGPMTTRYAYDAQLHLRYIVSPEGFVTEYQYETNPANLGYGQQIASIDYAANAYNVAGLAFDATISESALNSWAAGISDKSTTRRTQTAYDYRGNISTVKSYSKLLTSGAFDTSSELSQTTYVYDQAGNLLSKLINGSSATETFIHDGLNRIVSSTDFNNVTTTIAFNDAARTTVVSLANGLTQTSLYGNNGELLTYTESGAGVTSAVNRFYYDSLGRLRATADALWQPEIFFYDAIGQKTASVDSDGTLTEYAYDARGNLSATVTYATRLSEQWVYSLWDESEAYILEDFRPAAHADDRWNFYVYDAGQRLIQSIDGTGATTTYGYDGASRLIETKQHANRLTANQILMLKYYAFYPSNYTYGDSAWDWDISGASIDEAGMIEGHEAFEFTATTSPAYIRYADSLGSANPALVTTSFYLKASGWATSHEFGFYREELVGDGYEWSGDGEAIILSGPGTLTRLDGCLWRISGLSATEATRIQMTTTTGNSEDLQARIYISVHNPMQVQQYVNGDKIIIAGPRATLTTVGAVMLPPADTANDRLTRNFYDRDNRLIGTLDAEGYLTKIFYDKAGQKMKTVAYSGATAVIQRPSGTFANLLATVTIDNAKDIHTYCVYDARGFLRAEVDGEGNLTRYAYTPLGDLSEVVTGQKLDPAALLTTPPTFANLPAPASGTVLQTISYTRNHYGQVLTETKSLTGGTSTLTTYAYDSGRRLVSTTTQSGGPEARIESRRYDVRGRLDRELSGIGSALLAALGPNPDEELSEPIWTEYGTLYGYDEADRLIKRTDANGGRTLYYYDADDRLAFEVDATGAVVEYRYDAFGGRTDTIVYAARFNSETFVEMTGGAAADIAGDVAALASLALDQRSIAVFDVAGRVRASRDPLGSLTIYEYNSFGDLVSTTVPLESGLAAPSIVTPDFSFETPETGTGTTFNPTVSGVTFSTRSGVTGNGSTLNFAAAPDGDQVAFIQSNSGGSGSITMTVTGLNAGTSYQLSYMLAKSGSAAASQVTVAVDGQMYSSWVPGSTSFAQNSFSFVAKGSTATVVFAGGQSSTEKRTALDKVVVTQLSSVPNSSFEAPEVGTGSVYSPGIWGVTFSTKAGVAGNGSSWGFAAAPDGDQVAFLQSNSGGTGSISETLTNLIPGRSYQLSFYLAKRSSANANPVTVSIDGHVLGTFTPSSTGFVQFTTSAFQVTGTSAVLTFSGAASATEQVTALDKVVVTQLASNNLRSSFSYDRRGLLKTEIVDSAAGGKAITTSYGYDAFGRAVELTDPNSEDAAIVYDRAGRIVSTTDALGNGTFLTYDASGNLVAVKDALDHVTRYVYDSGGRPIFAVDALGGVIQTSYDGDGRVLATRAYSDSISLDGLGLQIAAADVTVQLTTSPGDRITRNAYDKDGRLKFVVDGAGGLTEYRYDDAGNAVRTIRYDWTVSPASTYTVDDLQAEVDTHASDPMRIARAVYDAAGRVTFEIDPTGHVTAFTHDSAGRVIKQVAFATTYDISNDPLNDVMQGWALANEQSDDRVSRAIYDRKGRLVYSVDAEGFVTEYRYNKLDSIVKEIRYATPYTVGDGATVAGLAQQIGSLPPSAIVTDLVYDSAGRIAETVDGLGHRTVMTLDQRGQILSSTVAYGTSDAVTTTRSYDALGRLLSETRAEGTAAEMTTAYGYNALGELVSVTRAVGTAAEWTTLRRYDVLGRLHSELSGIGSALIAPLGPDPDQEVVDPIWAEYGTFYAYDEAGRLTSTSNAVGARTLFYHDTADRLVYQVDELGAVVEYRYNALGDRTETILYAARINNETLWELVGGDASDVDAVLTALANAALDEKMVATHDSAGRMILRADPLGALTSYAYNAFGELELQTDPLGVGTAIQTSFIYDRRGLLTSRVADSAAGGKAITTGYEYDAFGRPTTLTDPNTYVTASEYDKDGRVILERDAFDEPTYFTYDARGNLVAVTDALGHITRYVYDAADRRIFAVDALGGVVETSYDGDGRVVATRAYADEISLDGFGLQISASAVTGRLTTDAGDRIARNAYDKDGRLRFTVDGISALTEYRYDDVGNAVRIVRHSWTVSPASTYTLDDLQAQVDAHPAAPARTVRAVYNAAGRMTFSIDAAGNVTAFTHDSAGRVIKQTAFVTAYTGGDEPLDDVMQGWAAGSVHADDRVSRAIYDRKGQLAYSVDAEGFVTEFRYNEAGRTTLQIRYAIPYAIADGATPASVAALLPGTIPQSAEITEFLYDSAGRLEGTRDGLNILTLMTLDQRGQILSSTVAYGTSDAVTTTRSYDALGRLLSETRAEGTAAETTTAYGYNALGEIVSVTRAVGTAAEWTTLRRYDVLGRLHSELSGIGSALIAALGPDPDQEVVDPIWAEYGTFYAYDEAGRLTSTSNAVGARTLFYHDTADRLVYQVDELGAVVEYRYNALGDRTETIAYAARINNETLWEMTGGKASDADAIVTALADVPLDEKTVAIYDSAGRLSQISGQLGAYTAYAYDSFGAVNLRRDAFGESATPGVATEIETSFNYDRRGLLTSQIVDSAAGGKAITTAYEYDALGRVVETTDANNHVTARAFDRGGRVSSRTDALDNVTEYTYDARGNLVAVKDALDQVTRYVYDAADRLIFAVDALGGVIQTSYDGDGRVVAMRAYAAEISVGSFGLQISASNVIGQLGSGSPDDRITRNAYDKDGRLRFTVDGAGLLTEYRYDDVGNGVRTTRHGWTVSPASTYTVEDLQAQVDAHASAPSRVSRAVYDATGRMTFAIDATNRVTAFSYDSMGRVIKQVVYATAYDSVPEPLDWEMQGWVAAAAHADDRTSRSIYDLQGRLAYSVDAENYVTEYRYNRLGLVTSQIRYADPYPVDDGATAGSMATLLPSSVPQSAVTTDYFYDSAGRLEKTMDAIGTWTVMTLDQLGQIRSSTRAHGTVDAATTEYTYDALGRVETETRAAGTAGEATTVYDYDPLGALVTITYAAGTADECVTSMTYDAAGRLETQTRGDGSAEEVTTVYGYNAFGDLESMTSAAGTVDAQLTTWDYDLLGRLESETSAVGTADAATTAYAYNAFGNLAKVTDPRLNSAYFYYDGRDRLVMQVDPEGYVTETGYELGDEPMSVTRYATRVSGATITAAPTIIVDAAEDATTTFLRDKLDRLTGIVDAEDYEESYELNAFGDRISVTNKVEGTIYNVYDERGLLIQETLPINSVRAEDGVVMATSVVNKFEYDRRGNRTKMIEAFGLDEVRTTRYFYDAHDRLIEQRGEALTVTGDTLATSTVTPSQFFTYDRRGNLIETVNANGAHTWSFYDHLNRKTDQVDALGTLSSWDYDGNGNVEKSRVYAIAVSLPGAGARTAPTGGTAYRETLYTYDANNRLTHTRVVGIATAEYVGGEYNQIDDEVVTQNVYDSAGNLVRRIDGRGNSLYSFYDKLGRKIAQVDEKDYLTSYTLDAEGNVLKEERFATKLSGAVTTASDPAALRASVVNGAKAADNRVTEFLYDRNGRRTHETRLNVNGKVLSEVGGLQAAATTYAQIRYEYNGLGQVVLKTEANGDFTEYSYDSMGRETSVQSKPYDDYQNVSVRNKVETFYNGLSLVTRSIERSKSGTADRITRSTYSTGGRLASSTDATGFTRSYGYDAEGQMVMERYDRATSDDSTVTEAAVYRYDLAGRVVFQATATLGAGGWTFGAANQLRYNAFGEVTGRGLNVVGDSWQETFDYDLGGRMWRSTAEDGSIRVYLHDATGKVTLTAASEGVLDLSAYSSITPILASIGNDGSSNIGGLVTTVTVYDERGQGIEQREPSREIAEGSTTTITTSRIYNAFGEVEQETDARGKTTSYGYNTMGRLIKRELPLTSYTDEHGTIFTNVRPTEHYSYDLSGRRIGVQDANGWTTTRRLLSGTGYGNSEATVLAEYHPDDGVVRHGVDEFGEVRTSTDEISRVTNYTYDQMGRLTELVRPNNSLTESYRYDGLGQRLKHWTSHYGSGVVDRTDYDAEGRVTKVIQASGSSVATEIHYDYLWDGEEGDSGAWIKTTTHLGRSNNNDSSESSNYFGRLISTTDLGDHTTTYTYNLAAQLTQQTSSASQNITFTYFNTGKVATITDNYGDATYSPASVQSTFAYDEAGNRVFEGYVKTTFEFDYETGYTTPLTQTLQAATVTYDEIGRMKTFHDTGATGSNPAEIKWEYDLVGNVRMVDSKYTPLLVYSSEQFETEHWYTYDKMDRMVHVMGYLAGERGTGEILNDISTVGSGYALYNAAGERTAFVTNYFVFEGAGAGFGLTKEEYFYNAQGYLEDVTQSTLPIDIITQQPSGPWSTPILIASDTRDALGRLTAHDEYRNGENVYSTSTVYNELSLKTSEATSTIQYDDSLLTTNATFDYKAESSPGSGLWTGDFQGGVVTHVRTVTNQSATAQHTTNSYVWWDDARLSVVTNKPSATVTYTSTYSYDENGKLASVNIQDGRPRIVNFVTDLYGQVMSRTEYTPSTPNQNNPKDIYYYFNGLRVGDIGNNGPSQVDYVTAISERGAPPQTGPFKNGMATYHADFNQAFDPISPGSEPSAAGRYVVRDGDTLQSIARAVWGDSAMWYLIADANGLSGSAILVAGQTIRIPPKVTNVHNNSETFRVYDPNEAIGDVSPTQVGPPRTARRGGGCGILGQILLIAIAVAITLIIKVPVTNLIAFGSTVAPLVPAAVGSAILVPAVATAGAAIAGAVITGAVASVVSQGIGVATGIQDKFSWKGVALSALSAGVTQGVGGGQLINGAGKFVNDVVRGALVNAATQGVAVATGLQKKFDWLGIGVAGVVSGVTGAVSRSLPGKAQLPTATSDGRPASQGNIFASSFAGAFAGASVRSIVTGTSFGDNLLAVLPDVIGTTIGNMIGNAVIGNAVIDGMSDDESDIAAELLEHEHEHIHGASSEADEASAQSATPGDPSRPSDESDMASDEVPLGWLNPIVEELYAQEVAGQTDADGVPLAWLNPIIDDLYDREVAQTLITPDGMGLTPAGREALRRQVIVTQTPEEEAPQAPPTDMFEEGFGVYKGGRVDPSMTHLRHLSTIAITDVSDEWIRDKGVAWVRHVLGPNPTRADFIRLAREIVADSARTEPYGLQLRGARYTIARFSEATQYREGLVLMHRILDSAVRLNFEIMERGLMNEFKAFAREYIRIGGMVNPFLFLADTAIAIANNEIGPEEAIVRIVTLGRSRVVSATNRMTQSATREVAERAAGTGGRELAGRATGAGGREVAAVPRGTGVAPRRPAGRGSAPPRPVASAPAPRSPAASAPAPRTPAATAPAPRSPAASSPTPPSGRTPPASGQPAASSGNPVVAAPPAAPRTSTVPVGSGARPASQGTAGTNRGIAQLDPAGRSAFGSTPIVTAPAARVATPAPVAVGTPYRQLSRSARTDLLQKVENRTITRGEWQRLRWNDRLAARRQEGVDAFWARERQDLARGLPGTRNWSAADIDAIMRGRNPQGMFAHHKYSVSLYPQLANNPSNIIPVTFGEHFHRWHGGNWRNPSHGVPLNPNYPLDF